MLVRKGENDTAVRMIAGLMEPSAGEMFLDDRPITRIPAHRRNIGMLFQNYALFPHMTVAENVAFGLEARGFRRVAAAARVLEALRLVRDFEQVRIRVHDSTAAMRYLVLPMRPAGTEHLDEAALASLVTRDAMIGVTVVRGPASQGVPA